MTGLRQLPALPQRAWLPGHGEGPDRLWLDAVKDTCTDSDLVATGFHLVRSGYFWEAHELLEKAWANRSPNAPEREMLRAVIQIANALLKARQDKAGAVARLLQDAQDTLAALHPGRPVFGLTPVNLQRLIVAALAGGAGPEGMQLAELQKLPTCKKMQLSRSSL